MEDNETVKIEFAVQMTCKSCENSVKKVLESNPDIRSFSVDLPNERVIVETGLDAETVRSLLETSGRKAIVRGVGTTASGMQGQDFGSGVSILHKDGAYPVIGVTRIFQPSDDSCVVEGTIDGLAPNRPHAVRVHEAGDLSEGCDSCGPVFAGDIARKVAAGDIGVVTADADGRASFRLTSSDLKLWDVIGRSIVMHELQQDGARRVACGVIARSAGLFANDKKVCACDGVPLWDEKVEPLRFPPTANL